MTIDQSHQRRLYELLDAMRDAFQGYALTTDLQEAAMQLRRHRNARLSKMHTTLPRLCGKTPYILIQPKESTKGSKCAHVSGPPACSALRREASDEGAGNR